MKVIILSMIIALGMTGCLTTNYIEYGVGIICDTDMNMKCKIGMFITPTEER